MHGFLGPLVQVTCQKIKSELMGTRGLIFTNRALCVGPSKFKKRKRINIHRTVWMKFEFDYFSAPHAL